MKNDHFLIRAFIFSVFFLLSLWIIAPYVEAVIWGVLIAILTKPLYRHLKKFFENSAYPALGVVFLLVCLFIVLFSFFSIYLSFELKQVISWIRENGFNNIKLPTAIKNLPFVGEQIDTAWMSYTQNIDKEKLLNIAASINKSQLMREAFQGFSSLFRVIFLFFLTNIVLFFVLKNGNKIMKIIDACFDKNLLNWQEYKKIIITCVRGIGFTFLIIGIGTSVIMTIVYSICGLPVPLLLGAITAVLVVIPFTLPLFYILLSAFLLLQGKVIFAIVLLGIGVFINLISDNWLQPYLISGDSKIHFLIVLFGILGGVSTLGLKGIILGPLILSLLYTAIINYIHHKTALHH